MIFHGMLAWIFSRTDQHIALYAVPETTCALPKEESGIFLGGRGVGGLLLGHDVLIGISIGVGKGDFQENPLCGGDKYIF